MNNQKNILSLVFIFLSFTLSLCQSDKEFKKSDLTFELCDDELDQKECFNNIIAIALTDAVKTDIKTYLKENKKRTYVVSYAHFIIGENGKAIKESIRTTKQKNTKVSSKLKRAVLNLPEIKVKRNEYNYPVLSSYRIRIKNGLNDNEGVVLLDKSNKSSKKRNRVAPIYPGCKYKDNDSLTKCLNNNISKLVQKKFRVKKASKGFNKKGSFYIYLNFSIDSKGKIVNEMAFGPNESFEEEALSILKKVKKIKPATKDGKPIKEHFTLPIKLKFQE